MAPDQTVMHMTDKTDKEYVLGLSMSASFAGRCLRLLTPLLSNMGRGYMLTLQQQTLCIESVRMLTVVSAASPYVTAVGGTNFAGETIGDETAWDASGGGFSDTFDMPAYQKDAVAAYKSSRDADLPPWWMWKSSGRGFPDVAALGGTKTPYCIISDGEFSGVAGTSASSPVVAGIFALLNGLRASSGQRPLGFLNPFIYQNPDAFQDVTSGKNTGGEQSYGFKAIKGWDAATGMGTPDYEALSKAVLADAKQKHSITGTGPTTTEAGCEPMTSTDPCFEYCHMGNPQNCNSAICEKAGKIGCKGAQCVLMGKDNTDTSHCMSPMMSEVTVV